MNTEGKQERLCVKNKGARVQSKEPQKQLKKGKCGWLDAERDIGGVEVKVSDLKRCLHVGEVFTLSYRKWGISAGTIGCQQSSSTAQKDVKTFSATSNLPALAPTPNMLCVLLVLYTLMMTLDQSAWIVRWIQMYFLTEVYLCLRLPLSDQGTAAHPRKGTGRVCTLPNLCQLYRPYQLS